MQGGRKWDVDAACEIYISDESLTLRDIADRIGLSIATVANVSAERGWKEKRRKYQIKLWREKKRDKPKYADPRGSRAAKPVDINNMSKRNMKKAMAFLSSITTRKIQLDLLKETMLINKSIKPMFRRQYYGR